MNLKFFNIVTLFIICAGALGLSAQEKGNAAERAEKIVIDKNFLTGKLDNGLTYYIRKATNPAKSAEFYIVHNVGSLQENDSQRGLAHFLEHMAFNGTKNFPGKELLNSMAKIGVKFGANINAYTAMDRTVYNISAVPMLRSSITDSVLLMLHDWSSFISCEPEEIEAERGVVLEEWRRGDDPRTRMILGINELEQSGSRFSQRRVIGLPQIITSFTRDTLIAYYKKWYRPDLQAVVVVGDVDPQDIEQRIKRIFADIPAAKADAAVRESYPMPADGKPVVGRYLDPELKAISARFVVRYPLPNAEEKQSVESIKGKLIIDLITDMMAGRCAAHASGAAPMFKNVIPTNADTYYAWRNFRLTALPFKNNLEQAMTGILMEYERMLRYGFAEDELKDAKITKRSKISKEEKKDLKAKNEDYVDMAVEAFTRNTPLYDIPAYYKSMREQLDKITVADIKEFMEKNLGYKNIVLVFAGSDTKTFSSDERMHAIIDSLRNTPLEKYVHVSKNELAFNAKLSPKAISSQAKDVTFNGSTGKEIAAKEIALENGVKILYTNNPTLTDKEVRMYSFRKGGYSVVSDEDLPNARMLNMGIANYTPNGIKKNDFNRYISDNQMFLSRELTYEHDIMEGRFNIEDAERFFKTLYLSVNNSSLTPKVFNDYKARLVKDASLITGSRRFSDTCRTLTYKESPMLERITKEQAEALTKEALDGMFNKHFGEISNTTFIFESNGMSLDDLLPYFEKYITNMNSSDLPVPSKTADRKLYWKEGIKDLRFHDAEVLGSKASVKAEIFTSFKYNSRNIITAKYFTYLLREYYTKSIREERGGSYTIMVEEEFFSVPSEYMKHTIDFDTNAQMAEELVGCVWDAVEQLAKVGPTDDNINSIKLYFSKFAKERRELHKSVIPHIVAELTGSKSADQFVIDIIESITAKDVQKLAKNIMKQKNFSTYVYLPQNNK